MRIRIIIIINWLFLAINGYSQTDFPIVGWNGIPERYTSIERYKEMSEAGINVSVGGFTSLVEAIKALDAAQECDVKLILNCPELYKDTENTVRSLMKHPALYGYILRDEPSAIEFPGLKKLVDRIKSIDNHHICYINLFPNYTEPKVLGTDSYSDYVRTFIETFDFRINSFDNYPVVAGKLRPGWYENLEIFRKYTQESKSTFWAFALITSYRSKKEVIRIEDVRLQVYSNLVYGAQGIQYFTYWTPSSNTTSGFYNGPISNDGIRTNTYQMLQLMNKEITPVIKIFNNSQLKSIYHSDLTEGTIRYNGQLSRFFQFRSKVPSGLIISYLENEGKTFIVILNKSLSKVINLKAYHDKPCIVIDKGREIKISKNSTKKYKIDEGDILVFQY